MSRAVLKERLRQLYAIEVNAKDIYTDLASMSVDKEMKAQFLLIAADEARHAALEKELLTSLESV